MPTNPKEPLKTGPKQKRGDRARLLILNAVVESLAETGIIGTTYDEISRRTKLRRSHLVFYFPNIPNLIAEATKYVMRTAVECTEKAVQQESTAIDKIFAVADGACDHLEKNPSHAAVLGVFYHFCTHLSEFREIQAYAQDAGTKRMCQLLKETGMKSKTEIETTAILIRSLIAGYILYAVTTAKKENQSVNLNTNTEFLRTRKEMRAAIAKILAHKPKKKSTINKGRSK